MLSKKKQKNHTKKQKKNTKGFYAVCYIAKQYFYNRTIALNINILYM